MLFKDQAFAGFVATSELSFVATSEFSQIFFPHVFSGFQTIAPTLPKLEWCHILSIKLFIIFIWHV